MKTSEMRKLVSRMLKNGELHEQGDKPAMPSRYIYNMRKNDLQNVIDTQVINYDNDNKVYSKPAEKPAEKAEKPAEIKEVKSGANYVTDKGLVSLSRLAEQLGINDLKTSIANGSGAVNITIDSVPAVTLENQHLHPQFEDVLFHTKLDRNIYLYGSAGSGKTTIAKQIAEGLNCEEFGVYSCSANMSESIFTGKCLFDGRFFDTKFRKIVKNGGLVLIDEFDACDGNLLVALNAFFANGVLQTPNNENEPEVIRHPDCYIICAGNTSGNGNGSRIYSGRNKLDGATLDRFTFIKFEYDSGLEKKLSGGHSNLFKALNKIRKKVDEFEIEQIISSRKYLLAGRWLSAGRDLRYALETITACWTEREKEKVELEQIISDFN